MNQNGEAGCECPTCRGEGDDPVCGMIGDRIQTFNNLCRLQRRACKEKKPFELLYEESCAGTILYDLNSNSHAIIMCVLYTCNQGQKHVQYPGWGRAISCYFLKWWW